MSASASLRVFTWLEGVSYLLLLCVAMPLKYGFDVPLAVRIAGGLHGVLFLAFLLGLYQAQLEQGWPKRFTLSLLGASLVPGSLWWLDRKIVSAGVQVPNDRR
jgi:integral membrane protein